MRKRRFDTHVAERKKNETRLDASNKRGTHVKLIAASSPSRFTTGEPPFHRKTETTPDPWTPTLKTSSSTLLPPEIIHRIFSRCYTSTEPPQYDPGIEHLILETPHHTSSPELFPRRASSNLFRDLTQRRQVRITRGYRKSKTRKIYIGKPTTRSQEKPPPSGSIAGDNGAIRASASRDQKSDQKELKSKGNVDPSSSQKSMHERRKEKLS